MSRRCELTGKGPMTGNNVSHANNKTKRRFLPNLNDVTLQSETLGRGVKAAHLGGCLRSVDHRGGLDAFLAKAKDEELSANALKVKKEIAKAKPRPKAFFNPKITALCPWRGVFLLSARLWRGLLFSNQRQNRQFGDVVHRTSAENCICSRLFFC